MLVPAQHSDMIILIVMYLLAGNEHKPCMIDIAYTLFFRWRVNVPCQWAVHQHCLKDTLGNNYFTT